MHFLLGCTDATAAPNNAACSVSTSETSGTIRITWPVGTDGNPPLIGVFTHLVPVAPKTSVNMICPIIPDGVTIDSVSIIIFMLYCIYNSISYYWPNY